MWVLVVVLYAFGPGATSVAMHDFSDQANCEKAKAVVVDAQGGPIHVKAECVAK